MKNCTANFLTAAFLTHDQVSNPVFIIIYIPHCDLHFYEVASLNKKFFSGNICQILCFGEKCILTIHKKTHTDIYNKYLK